MKIRIYGLQNDSIVDGPGIRYAVFVQGCCHHCVGCHNPASHDLNGGTEYEISDILDKIKANPLLDGVTFTGGEPFLYAKALSCMAEDIHNMGLHIMAYTGFTYEQLIEGANEENGWMSLLVHLDILVDGPFLEEQRSIALLFKGSANQRIIDVPESLKSGIVVSSTYENNK